MSTRCKTARVDARCRKRAQQNKRYTASACRPSRSSWHRDTWVYTHTHTQQCPCAVPALCQQNSVAALQECSRSREGIDNRVELRACLGYADVLRVCRPAAWGSCGGRHPHPCVGGLLKLLALQHGDRSRQWLNWAVVRTRDAGGVLMCCRTLKWDDAFTRCSRMIMHSASWYALKV